ncbi:MAG TPA: lanthionine synthetase LanC family protein [Luteibaculaceae bacterium]|nr:lanthionine synthetase LanC family protein [Luteibaculaceae bacterium]
MNKSNLESRLRREIETLVQKIHNQSVTETNGRTWATQGLDDNAQIVRQQSESLYCGVGGIALFFQRYGQISGDPGHLMTASEAMDWCASRVEQGVPHSQAFVTGWLGLATALVEAHLHQPNDRWYNAARKIVLECLSTDPALGMVDDYINGMAGQMHGLMFLQPHFPDLDITDYIERLAYALLDKAWLTPKGLYWDRGGQQVCGLCGFSHGASGVAYAFAELARFTRNDGWLLVSRLAFAYEDYHFDKDQKNWPDFRRGAYTDADKQLYAQQYASGNKAFFEQHHDMNAWCHGAAGIGLARLRFYQQTGDLKVLRTGVKAINKTVESDVNQPDKRFTFTLCHGGGGNADLFVLAYEVLKDPKYLQLAGQVAEQSLDFHAQKGYCPSGYNQSVNDEDTSLFMGMAGIAYFYLRYLTDGALPSLLAPRVEICLPKKRPIPKPIMRTLLSKYFPSSVLQLDDAVFENLEAHAIRTFVSRAELHFSSNHLTEALAELRWEHKLAKFDLQGPSQSWLFVKRSYVNQLNPAAGLPEQLVLDEDCRLWKHHRLMHLVIRTPIGVQAQELNDFLHLLLASFSQPARVAEVIAEISAAFGVEDANERLKIVQVIEEQIWEAYRNGILLKAE